MNDTYITLVGNALNAPERKQIERSGVLLVNFKVISNVRRRDDSGQWYDAANFRVKVNCWRRLADHVLQSIRPGDPVIVYGKITTHEWRSESGEPRVAYQLDAEHVGHDLRWGIGEFSRRRYDEPNSMVDDADTESRVNGEPTQPVPDGLAAVPDAYGYDESYASAIPDVLAEDANAMLRDIAYDTAPTTDVEPGDGPDNDDGEDELVGAAGGPGGAAGRGRRRGR